jgi:hypothetical protein
LLLLVVFQTRPAISSSILESDLQAAAASSMRSFDLLLLTAI